MKHAECRLGCECTTGSGKTWRCTDIGTRVIVAVCLDDHPDDESWRHGPPYAIAEHVFDEDDRLLVIQGGAMNCSFILPLSLCNGSAALN